MHGLVPWHSQRTAPRPDGLATPVRPAPARVQLASQVGAGLHRAGPNMSSGAAVEGRDRLLCPQACIAREEQAGYARRPLPSWLPGVGGAANSGAHCGHPGDPAAAGHVQASQTAARAAASLGSLEAPHVATQCGWIRVERCTMCRLEGGAAARAGRHLVPQASCSCSRAVANRRARAQRAFQLWLLAAHAPVASSQSHSLLSSLDHHSARFTGPCA